MQAYRDCMKQNGVDLPAAGGFGGGFGRGQGGGGPSTSAGTPSNTGGTPADSARPPRTLPPGVDQATYDKAQAACHSKLPTGGFGGGQGRGGPAYQAYLSCLRDNGVPVPTTQTGVSESASEHRSQLSGLCRGRREMPRPTTQQRIEVVDIFVLHFHEPGVTMKRRNVVMNSVLVVAVVGVGALGFESLGTSSASTTSTSTQTTVKRGIVLSSVSASGNVIVPNQVALSFSGSGTVTKVLVNVGDLVKAGQALATIDDGSAKVTLETAQAQLALGAGAVGDAQGGRHRRSESAGRRPGPASPAVGRERAGRARQRPDNRGSGHRHLSGGGRSSQPEPQHIDRAAHEGSDIAQRGHHGVGRSAGQLRPFGVGGGVDERNADALPA